MTRIATRAAALLERAAGHLVAGSVTVARAPVVQVLARCGFVAKATLYGVVGALAMTAGLGLRGGEEVDTKDALTIVFEHGRGHASVAILAIALGGLGLWFVLEALGNLSGATATPMADVSRVGQAVGGLGYLGLALVAARLAAGEGAGPSGDAIIRSLVARYLALPAGGLAVSVVGVAAAVIGIRLGLMGVTGACLAALDLSRGPPRLRRTARVLGAIGFTAQGTLFALVGVFLVRAALQDRPSEAAGTRGALRFVAANAYGEALLLAMGGGLLAYAVYAALEGAFRRMPS
jgi:hypothetical protein